MINFKLQYIIFQQILYIANILYSFMQSIPDLTKCNIKCEVLTDMSKKSNTLVCYERCNYTIVTDIEPESALHQLKE